MRSFPIFGSYAAALIAAATARPLEPLMPFSLLHETWIAPATKRRRTGSVYPHSSTRQRARYARQLAAGQLNIARV